MNLENTFTVFFTRNELHAGSMVDLLQFLQGAQLKEVGCNEHGRSVTRNIIKFYALIPDCTFFQKQRSQQRQKQKLLKMRRGKRLWFSKVFWGSARCPVFVHTLQIFCSVLHIVYIFCAMKCKHLLNFLNGGVLEV